MKRRRVKITGIGPVTPAGVGREAFWNGMLSGRSFITRFDQLGPEFGPFVAGVVEGFDVRKYAPKFSGQKLSARHSLMAVAASALALADAGVEADQFKRAGSILFTGTSMMDSESITRTIRGVAQKGLPGVYPRSVYTASPANVSATVAHALHLSPRMITFQSSCCSGFDAIGQAARLVADGEADLALCGGSEAPLFLHPLVEFRATGLTSGNTENPEKQCRPFDLWRTTGIVSEGACMLVLEPEESPRPGYAFVSGYSYASDNGGGNCSGFLQAMQLAVTDSKRRSTEIDAVSAWGPGHREIDAAEAATLATLVGDRLSEIPVTSIKGAVGNALGAAGAIQIGASALGMRHQTILPTVNWEFPDPACPLHLSAQPRGIAHRLCLLNAHGVSGSNSCMVLERC